MEKTDQYWTPILLWRKGSILDNYFTMEKGINIGQLFYYGEDGSILDTYFTMEKWINIGQIFNSYYSSETDQYLTHIILWRNGFF